jgi:small subunit ribosomal protein S15
VSITTERKSELIEKFGKESGPGASPVQIAIFTERIKNLTEHLKDQKKDFSTRRGLLKLIGKRRRLMNYYKAQDPIAYSALIHELGLRR